MARVDDERRAVGRGGRTHTHTLSHARESQPIYNHLNTSDASLEPQGAPGTYRCAARPAMDHVSEMEPRLAIAGARPTLIEGPSFLGLRRDR